MGHAGERAGYANVKRDRSREGWTGRQMALVYCIAMVATAFRDPDGVQKEGGI